MSSTTQGKSSDRNIGNLKNDPDHLLILVHGILARYVLHNIRIVIKKIILSSNLGEVGLKMNYGFNFGNLVH